MKVKSNDLRSVLYTSFPGYLPIFIYYNILYNIRVYTSSVPFALIYIMRLQSLTSCHLNGFTGYLLHFTTVLVRHARSFFLSCPIPTSVIYTATAVTVLYSVHNNDLRKYRYLPTLYVGKFLKCYAFIISR